MKPKAYLTNARICGFDGPASTQVLYGNCWGHSRVVDSHRVVTSMIVNQPGPRVFETENTIYRVLSWGEPKTPQEIEDEDYAAANAPA